MDAVQQHSQDPSKSYIESLGLFLKPNIPVTVSGAKLSRWEGSRKFVQLVFSRNLEVDKIIQSLRDEYLTADAIQLQERQATFEYLFASTQRLNQCHSAGTAMVRVVDLYKELLTVDEDLVEKFAATDTSVGIRIVELQKELKSLKLDQKPLSSLLGNEQLSQSNQTTLMFLYSLKESLEELEEFGRDLPSYQKDFFQSAAQDLNDKLSQIISADSILEMIQTGSIDSLIREQKFSIDSFSGFAHHFAAIMAYANTIHSQGYKQFSWNDSETESLQSIWHAQIDINKSTNFVKNSLDQVPAVLALSRCNNGGKSVFLETDMQLRTDIQLCGYGPGAGGNIHLNQALEMLTRIEQHTMGSLSSHELDVEQHKRVHALKVKRKKVYIDEPFSATAGKTDSYPLTRATIEHGRKLGISYALTTHNKELIDWLDIYEDAENYHLEVKVDNNNCKCTYKLAPGAGQHIALAIAKQNELPEEFLEAAVAYFSGKMLSIGAAGPRSSRRFFPTIEGGGFTSIYHNEDFLVPEIENVASWSLEDDKSYNWLRSNYFEQRHTYSHVPFGTIKYLEPKRNDRRAFFDIFGGDHGMLRNYNGELVSGLPFANCHAAELVRDAWLREPRDRKELGSFIEELYQPEILEPLALAIRETKTYLRALSSPVPELEIAKVLEPNHIRFKDDVRVISFLVELLKSENPTKFQELIKVLSDYRLALDLDRELLEEHIAVDRGSTASLVDFLDSAKVRVKALADKLGINIDQSGRYHELDKLREILSERVYGAFNSDENQAECKITYENVSKLSVEYLKLFANDIADDDGFFVENKLFWNCIQTLHWRVRNESALKNLVDLLSDCESSVAKQFANYFESIFLHSLSQGKLVHGEVAKEQHIIAEQLETGITFAQDNFSYLSLELYKFSSLFYIASIMSKKGYVKTQIDGVSTVPKLKIKAARHIAISTRKSEQLEEVKNDYNFDINSQVQVGVGRSAAGKSFDGQRLAFTVSCANGTDFAPADLYQGTELDGVLFLGREELGSNPDASSYVNFIIKLKDLLSKVERGGRYLIILDEVGSNTSSEEERAIYLAIVKYLAERGNLVRLYCHNQDFARDVETYFGDRSYVFHFGIEEEGGVQVPTFKEHKGCQSSDGIEVAQKNGLEPSICSQALIYRNELVL